MATTYYVDPAAAGDNNGTTWEHAWTSLQSAADTAVAGDTVYCRGTQTLAATIDFDTQTGSTTTGLIKYIGCNSEGNVDGTRFTLDANDQSIHAITTTNTADLVWFENFRFTNTGTGAYHGVHTSGSSSTGFVFIGCSFDNCGGWGCNGTYLTNSTFVRCVAYSNGSDGFYCSGTSNRYYFCCSRDNGGSGFNDAKSCVFYGCIAHGNGDDGFENIQNANAIINCVIDGNVDNGIDFGTVDTSMTAIIGCRITNHSGSGDIGLNCNSKAVITGYNYFEANDGDNIQNATYHYFIPIEGGTTTTNIEDQSNTNQGYVDPTNHDFSTGYTDSGDPDLRRTAITVPWS